MNCMYMSIKPKFGGRGIKKDGGGIFPGWGTPVIPSVGKTMLFANAGHVNFDFQ